MSAVAVDLVEPEVLGVQSAQTLTDKEEVVRAEETARATEASLRMAEARARVLAEQQVITEKGVAALQKLSRVPKPNGVADLSQAFKHDGLRELDQVVITNQDDRPKPKIDADHTFIKHVYYIEQNRCKPREVVVIPFGVAGAADFSKRGALVSCFTHRCETVEEAQQMVSDLKTYHAQQRNYGIYIPK